MAVFRHGHGSQGHAARVDEPQNERRGQARIPCPPHAPGMPSPDGAGHERERAEEHAELHGGGGKQIVLRGAGFQVQRSRDAGERKAYEAPPCERQMNVEDFLCHAHDLFFRGVHKDEPLAYGQGKTAHKGKNGGAGMDHQSSPL